jgi:hypothetical protein
MLAKMKPQIMNKNYVVIACFLYSLFSFSQTNGLDASISPNPSSNFVNLKSTERITNVSVFNVLGKNVWSRKANGFNLKLNLENLKAGIYILKIKSKHKQKNLKLIKN